MTDFGRLRRQVNAYKAHLTRSINSLNTQLDLPANEQNIQQIKQFLEQAQLKYEKWEDNMLKLQEDDDEDIDKNIESIDGTLDNLIKAKVAAQEVINRVEKPEVKSVKVDHVDQPQRAKNKVNLPKLELKKFNGINLECFQEWKQIFGATIDNSDLDDVEKFAYLKMSVELDAKKLIEGYPVTKENYGNALRDLEEAYGDEEVVIAHHVSKLLALPKQSSTSLRELYTSISAHVRSLDALGVDAESYSIFLIPIVKSKLDDRLLKEITKQKIKSIVELLDQLKIEVGSETSSSHLRTAFAGEVPVARPNPQNRPNYSRSRDSWSNQQQYQPIMSSAQALQTNTSSKYCIFCPGTQSHWVEDCRKLPSIPPKEVKDIVVNSNACLGCFRKGHYYRDCRAREKMRCQKCQSAGHHTALHFPNESKRSGTYVTVVDGDQQYVEREEQQTMQLDVNNAEKIGETRSNTEKSGTQVRGAQAVHALQGSEKIMPVMKARIIGNNGKRLEINVMLDACSDQSFIRSDVTEELKLEGPRIPMNVSGIGGTTNAMDGIKLVTTKVYNRSFTKEIKITLADIPVICKPVPRPAVPQNILESRDLRNLQLADDYSKDEEKEIHMLIGLDYYWKLVTGRNKVKKSTDLPIAMETEFGWILVSNSNDPGMHSQSNTNIQTMLITTEVESSINSGLKKFWEIEQEIIEKPITEESKQAVRKFHDSVRYDQENKKYIVGLPFIDDNNLGSNYKVAEKRLQSLVKKLDSNPQLKERYREAMSEYINSGFAELVPENEIYSSQPGIYYIPHRAVINEENATTKVRIVSDASSAMKNESSLNDKLLTGPKLQPSIVEIMIRWRMNPVALIADIRKMYLMISVEDRDRNSLRFLWIENGEVKHYRHTVLPFGLRSAPYLAIETVQSHIKKFRKTYPDVTESLVDSTYVDDYATGADTAEEAKQTVIQASYIMNEAGMELRKWKSNNPEVMQHCKEVSPSTDLDQVERKVLGMHWNSVEDFFYYVTKPPKLSSVTYISKRMIISSVAKLHDPLGLIAPIVFKAKMMIQKLWSAGLEWDENIQETQIANEWICWCEDLAKVEDIKVNRRYVPVDAVMRNQELHVFNDASEKGYATVAYLRTEDEQGKVHVSLITSKTKVAPLKIITLPRLELMAALIGSRISLKIKKSFKDEKIKLYCWSDSAISLQWIKNTEVRWKTFIENRVQEIRENTDPVQWRHCPGSHNPADVSSRGTNATTLKSSSLWWGGPEWLQEPENKWPQRVNLFDPNDDALEEKRAKQYTCLVADTNQIPVIEPMKYNHLCTLLRKIAYIRRFASNCHKKKLNQPLILNKFLTAQELDEARTYCLKLVQKEHYTEEIERLKAEDCIKRKSKISQLSPYLDEKTGLIRMRGRVQNAELTAQEKHPIILPHKSHIVKLLVKHEHLRQLHAGVNQTLVALRNDFWITNARWLVKTVVKACVVCRMYMPKRLTVPFSPLPADRVLAANPFEVIGVDFTGPIHIEETKMVTKQTTKKYPVKIVKVKTTSKAYVCLITCAVTRAIHLELVPDMTTDAFIRAFRRFISRRGTCSVVHSDNAATFKCADRVIKQSYEILNSPKFQEFISEKSIKWEYICPLSPWWGGFWERCMKTIKTPLKKILGKSILNADELYTILTEVEAMVNSRPLCSVNDDVENHQYLTPANFIIGRSTINLPVRPITHDQYHPNVTRKELNKILLYQEKTMNKVWKSWKEEYLRILGVCPAIKDKVELKEGDLVMVASNQQPRCTWTVGRVVEVIEGRDGRVRSAIVKSGGKLRTRPVQLLSKLEVSDN